MGRGEELNRRNCIYRVGVKGAEERDCKRVTKDGIGLGCNGKGESDWERGYEDWDATEWGGLRYLTGLGYKGKGKRIERSVTCDGKILG